MNLCEHAVSAGASAWDGEMNNSPGKKQVFPGIDKVLATATKLENLAAATGGSKTNAGALEQESL